MAKKFIVSSEEGTGSVEVGDENVVVVLGDKSVRFKRSYADAVEKLADLALGKVKVHLDYYDLLGSKESMEFGMNENDFRALKHLLGK